MAGSCNLVIAQGDGLHRCLRLRAGYGLPDLTAELCTLRALSLTAGATDGMDEIGAFRPMVSREILENPDAESTI